MLRIAICLSSLALAGSLISLRASQESVPAGELFAFNSRLHFAHLTPAPSPAIGYKCASKECYPDTPGPVNGPDAVAGVCGIGCSGVTTVTLTLYNPGYACTFSLNGSGCTNTIKNAVCYWKTTTTGRCFPGPVPDGDCLVEYDAPPASAYVPAAWRDFCAMI